MRVLRFNLRRRYRTDIEFGPLPRRVPFSLVLRIRIGRFHGFRFSGQVRVEKAVVSRLPVVSEEGVFVSGVFRVASISGQSQSKDDDGGPEAVVAKKLPTS